MEQPPRPVWIVGRIALLALIGLLVLVLLKVLVLLAFLVLVGYLAWWLILVLTGERRPDGESFPGRVVHGFVSTWGRVRADVVGWWREAWRSAAPRSTESATLLCHKGKLAAWVGLEVVSGAVVGALFVATAWLQQASAPHGKEVAMGALIGAALGGLAGRGRLHAARRDEEAS